MTSIAVTDPKQSILDAAEEIIARSGYAGLSMRELSKHSGLAKSTLYHHFEDKEQIYLSVLERDMFSFEERITSAAASATDCIARLRAVIATYMSLLSERGSLALNAIRRSGNLDEQLVALFGSHRDSIFRPFVEIFEQGISEGKFRRLSPELTTISLLGMMNSFAAYRLLAECQGKEMGVTGQELADHTINLFLLGIMGDGYKQSPGN